MNILYITPSFPTENEGDNIYTDLAEELSKNNSIKILVATGKSKIKSTRILNERNLDVLRVKIDDLYNIGLVKKAISFVTLQRKLKKAIDKYLSEEKFDLILFMAPPITLGNVVKYAMKKYNAKSFLMQKDIFPQNAIDLGILTKTNPAYWYFRMKEKQMYKIATKIGCMSQGNIEYLLKNNKFLKKNKMELFPNAIKIKDNIQTKESCIRKKYNILQEQVLAVYGGNFGKPQGIDFIIEVLNEYKNNENVVFLLAGKGTEQKRLFKFIKDNSLKNVIANEYIPKREYNNILKEADIGLVFLDYRFTIPNIPSRTLSYFYHSLPIMAATDKNTDYKDILVKDAQAGLWCESNNIEEFKKKFNYLIENKEERKNMGVRGREYLAKHWKVENVINLIKI